MKKNDSKNAVCFTGHRVIDAALIPQITECLDGIIENKIQNGTLNFYTGGAIGFDALAARRVLEAKKKQPFVNLILALPCRDQTNRWKKELDVNLYQEIKGNSDSICHIDGFYDDSCMMKRNMFMVDNSDCCIAYVTRSGGGSASTVRYAVKNGLEIINVADMIRIDT